MTNTKTYAITVATKDGARYAKPEASIEAGLLGGMVYAQAEATRTHSGSIAWTEVTDRFVKGHYIVSGERIAVYWADLPMAAEDQITDWLTEA